MSVVRTRFYDSVRQRYDAAVIGGGITGLTAAFRLSEDPNCKKVTLYEKSPRLGGYIESETIPVNGGKIVFEHGPRSIRAQADPNSAAFFESLLRSLGLSRQLVSISKHSPAARNRYIYYPDHLVRVPGLLPAGGVLENLRALYPSPREPAFRSLLSSVISEPFKNRPPDYPDDESVGEFISRRFSKQVADNLASAVFHGIYAGDIYKLSARTLLSQLHGAEAAHGSIIWSQIKDWPSKTKQVATARAMAATSSSEWSKGADVLQSQMGLTSVFTWEQGLGQLVDALADSLRKSTKVDVLTSTEVIDISQDPWDSELVVTFGPRERRVHRVHNRVIATSPAPDVARMLSNAPEMYTENCQGSIASLKTLNYAVSVMVVNLYYSNPNVVPLKGFGYLIPRSIPKEQNPEDGLGVIFASETSDTQDTAPGTKLTVMLGGHLWDDLPDSDYPDHDCAVAMARSMLKRQLGITEAPMIARSRLHRNAIPQYTVGHDARINEISRTVRTEFRQRLTLAGNWYDGVSVPDCITQGHLAALYGTGRAKSTYSSGDDPYDLEGGIALPPMRWHLESKWEGEHSAEES
ncbi:Protoporphyrinogen oxidase [Aspergillus sp. HF37]|nr:Protoporphyrinogen oxidase [Aspergillus sp. HF37]